MPRIRTIKPEFWQDEELSSSHPESALLAIGLLNISDDEGYFKAHPGLVKASIFPLRELSLSIHEMLNELSNIQYIELFTGLDGKQYGLVVNFTKHQKINRPTPSKIKELYKLTEPSMSTHEQVTAGKERKGTGKGKEQGKDSMSGKPDDVSEVINYLNNKGGYNFQPTGANERLIKARLKNYSVDNLLAVIDSKYEEWCSDEKMSKYIRPSTLFNDEKFSSYFGAIGANKVKPKSLAERMEDYEGKSPFDLLKEDESVISEQ